MQFIQSIFDRSPYQLAIIAGVLIGCAYPPFPGVTAWVGFIPLIHIWLTQPPKESARWTFFAGVISHIIAFYWIGLNSGASIIAAFFSMAASILYLSAIWAVFGWGMATIEKRFGNSIAIMPFAWASLEWLRAFGPLGFPWANLAITQTKILPLIQITDTTGSEGVAFWLILLNILVYLTIRSSGDLGTQKKVLALVFILPWIFGAFRIYQFDSVEAKEVRSVAAIQPNVNPNQKWEASFRDRLYTIMDSLNAEAYSMDPDLVLWPEAALPAYMRVSSSRLKYEWLVNDTKIPLAMGTVDYDRDSTGRRVYNGTIFFGINGNKMYHKIFLVPFAEYIPMSPRFPALKKLNFGQANFTHGDEFTTFPLDSVYFSNMICYESTHPAVARGFMNNGARFLTIEANDAWLRNSSGVRQHFELARLRAVEQRAGIIRSANTGISGLIQPSGRVDQKIKFGDQAVFLGEVILNQGVTFYGRYGSVFAQMCFILTLIQIVWLIRRQK
ncbi:MAG: apolipoprotein N-acyltransferase [Candidatus Marinimicrobia bacterium]|jgi:apolipoprotein N-acyltransferase|nr:apolipoprotein N-acyltransferase [Candidatus Neomarinimicrobiota bacterium]MDP6991840.1 apolipoprotein N-acyltransferase [Candidatus Neomarinimicrobiota bacterium]